MMFSGPFSGIEFTARDVALVLVTLVLFFLAFQVFYLRYPAAYFSNLMKGVVLTFAGMVLFLQGLRVAFLPAGESLGIYLGGQGYRWIIIPISFILGFLTTIAEPAVRILCSEVERASTGYIRSPLLLYTLASGVAGFVALGMARLVYDIPFLPTIMAGYISAIVLLPFADRDFIGIAFDAGGVATGPMAVTFLLAVSVGASSAIEGRTPVIDGFGLVAFIALAPILAVLVLGVVLRIRKVKRDAV
ncbi:MAG: DUF1538 domain-containing protein [Methanomicrobiales archaeon]|nr:DUF1538 domain-containing protein [Methanomicrobiales archaeon]